MKYDESLRALMAYLPFALLALVCANTLLGLDVDFPHPSQRESLRPQSLLPILALGALAAWLSVRAGLPAPPPRWGVDPRSAALVLALGVGLGLVAVFLDVSLGVSERVAAVLGVPTIHFRFPHSILAYTAGAIVVETLFRIIPLSVGTWLVWRLILRGRGHAPVFWTLAVITSLLEPVAQVAVLAGNPLAWTVMGAFIFAVNLVEAWLLRTRGVAAPIIARLVLYGVWHVSLGPLLVAG